MEMESLIENSTLEIIPDAAHLPTLEQPAYLNKILCKWLMINYRDGGQLEKNIVTHVGSLPRKQEVVDFIFARENNQKYNQDDFDNVMNKAVLETVKKQVDSGVDIVSDGETSKISYATYVKDRYIVFQEIVLVIHQLI